MVSKIRHFMVFLAIALIDCSMQAQEINEFGLTSLDNLIQSNHITSVEQFVKFLPAPFKTSNFTRVHFSLSLQPGPRILMFNNQLVFSINGTGHSIEGIVYSNDMQFPQMFRYEFDETQRQVPVKQDNPKICMGCHLEGSDTRFIIGERNSWPGIYGSGNGDVSKLDLIGVRNFKKFPRFDQFKGGGNIVSNGLFFQLASFNDRRFTEMTAAKFNENQKLSRFKYAVLGSLICISDFSTPSDLNPENEILAFIPENLIPSLQPSLQEQQIRSKQNIEVNISNKIAVSKYLESIYHAKDDVGHTGLHGDTRAKTTAFRYLMEANGIDITSWSTEFPSHSGLIGGVSGDRLVGRLLNQSKDKDLLALSDRRDNTRFCKQLKEESLRSLAN